MLIRWVPSRNFNHCIWRACCIAELSTKFLEYSLRWTIISRNGTEHWILLKEPLIREGCSFYIFIQHSFKSNFNYKLDLKSNRILFHYISFKRVEPAGNDARHIRKYEIEIYFFCASVPIFNTVVVIFNENRPALLNILQLNNFESCEFTNEHILTYMSMWLHNCKNYEALKYKWSLLIHRRKKIVCFPLVFLLLIMDQCHL